MFSVSRKISLSRVSWRGNIGNPQKESWVAKSTMESHGAFVSTAAESMSVGSKDSMTRAAWAFGLNILGSVLVDGGQQPVQVRFGLRGHPHLADVEATVL